MLGSGPDSLSSFNSRGCMYMELAGWPAGWRCWLLSGPEPAYLKSLMCFIWTRLTLSSTVRDGL